MLHDASSVVLETVMLKLLSGWCFAIAVACFASMGGAHAAGVSAADEKAIRAVVQAQLDAFAADDATRAFSFAAPGIRAMFGTADRFMAMVRTGYPVVYRPASVVFLKPELIDGEVIQGVRMTDASAAQWLAVYQMQRQPDKTWRIGGCQVVPSQERLT
jgi:Domain of unknown function (DUF4864)